MKIIITGGAGFIGSNVADQYIKDGHEVVIIDNLQTGKKENINPKAVFYNIDIRDSVKIREIFQKIKPDILNHHAAQLDVRKSVKDPLFDAGINIIGLLNLLEAGKETGVKKVIFASSGGVVYGDAKMLPTPESYCPLRPISPYGVTKLSCEHYLYYYYQTYHIGYVALRYANIYGPRQDPFGEAGVVAIFTKKLLKRENPIINGDGKQTRDYVYVADVVRANLMCLKTSCIGELNISTGIETSVNEIFHLLAKLTNSRVTEKHGAPKLGEQKRSILDNSLAFTKLGWKPRFNLTEGMKLTVEYFKNKYEKEINKY